MKTLIFGCIVLFLVLEQARAEEKKKYAPRYCLRMRFNCQKQAGHVCCRFPLPPNEKDIDTNSLRPSSKIHIRPIRLPNQRTPPPSDVQTETKNDESKKQAADSEVKENKPPVNNPSTDETSNSNDQAPPPRPQRKGPLLRRPPSNFVKNKGQNAERNRSPPRPSNKNTKNSPSGKTQTSLSSRFVNKGKKPRLCLRLVVNCNNSPEHRCCIYEKEEEEKEQGEEQGEQIAPQEDPLVQEKPNEALPTPPATNAITISEAPLPSRRQPAPFLRAPVTTPEPASTLPITVKFTTESSVATSARPTAPATSVGTTQTEPSAGPPEISSPYNEPSMNKHPTTLGWVSSVEKVELQVPQNHPKHPQQQGPPPRTQEVHVNDPYNGVPSLAVIHQKIPAECFTQAFDCNLNPDFMCCDYMR